MSGFSLAALKNTLDEVRVSVYAKNETEKKVYEALSSKNWGASSTQMNEIAQETHEYDKYQIINDIIWAALETEGKSWKQIFKALTLVEFLIKNGSERFIESARDKLFKIKRLQDYNYYEGTIDKGSGCREKAKQIVELLASNESIRAEREKARALRNKFGGVGSDSRGFGGGGSSSYGGSYGGSSDSYSNSGVDSRPHVGSSGRYGDDSYSSDRGNSRYDNDRYSDRGSANDRGSNNDRYNDRDRGGNTGRYGGGAYDSDRPPRFSDDGPQDRHDGGNEGRRGSYNARDDDVDVKPPSKSTPFAPKESNTAAGGKLKVSIKKAPAGGTVAAPPASSAAQVDLIGGDDFGAFGSTPAAPAAPAAAAFDPFGAAPSAPAASSAAFDPFGSAPTQPTSLLDAFATPAHAPAPAQPAFDPFNQPAPAPYAQPGQNFHGMQPQMAPSQPQQQQFGQFTGFATPAPAPLAPQPAPAQQPMYRTAPAPAAPEADFGDFEEAKPAAPAKAAAANKWGDLGNLVDLGGISKNAPAEKKNEAAAAANAAYASSSFAGLDGFSKTQQNMNAGGMGAPRPMGAPMMAPRPGGPPMMMGGAPMGAPMGGPMGVPMGAPMGGMAPAGGMGYGAPAPHMGMMGPGMGAPMGMAPGGMGGYGAPAPHMGGGYGGPAPMGMGMGMGGMPPGNMGPGGYPPQQQYRPAGPGGW